MNYLFFSTGESNSPTNLHIELISNNTLVNSTEDENLLTFNDRPQTDSKIDAYFSFPFRILRWNPPSNSNRAVKLYKLELRSPVSCQCIFTVLQLMCFHYYILFDALATCIYFIFYFSIFSYRPN